MPRSGATKTAKTAKPVQKPKKTTPAKKQTKKETVQTPVETVEVVEAPAEPETPLVSEVVSPGGTRTRREVTPETVDQEFTALLEDFAAEFASAKEAGRPVSKFHRSVAKRLAVLQRDTRRVSNRKRRNPGDRKANVNSGIMKESAISPELAKFLGVGSDTRMSRVECTRLLNNYIKDNGLKRETDGREIVPNKELTKLLGYTKKACVDTTLGKNGQPKNPDGKLYYWVIQKLIQRHFVAEN